jgi:hypothetical protein
VGVVLPANKDPALPLNPSEEVLDEPAYAYRLECQHARKPNIVARRHFALSRFDFRSFRVSVGKMTPGRGGYQSTNLPYTNEQIPESYESLADSNVRGICFRGNPG